MTDEDFDLPPSPLSLAQVIPLIRPNATQRSQELGIMATNYSFGALIERKREIWSALTSSSSSSYVAAAADTDTDIPPLQEKYDVFISFRGEDTRRTILSHLSVGLCGKKIETYIDDRLVRGDEIAPALLEAIERSAISNARKKNGQLVIPIFFDISPSDVRNQRGSYAPALRQLEKRFIDSIDKVHKWRAALTQASNLAGFDDSEKTE
ncbi:TMV resistance protein N-like [Prunus avium]|uniref:TMV resistance protein N-like n=1 Tax=Prunus avium TaxID=42229 RepID=A0A6P5T500_PRUAV|nr:TMV resistance protein N-like [Prunus avium]